MGATSIVMLIVGVIAILLLIWACLDGTKAPNRYGSDPKGGADQLHETFR